MLLSAQGYPRYSLTASCLSSSGPSFVTGTANFAGVTKLLKRRKLGTRLPMGVVTPCLIIVAALWAALIFYGSQSEKLAIKQGRSDASNLTMALRENVRGRLALSMS